MLTRVLLPLTLTPNPNLIILAESGKPEALNAARSAFDEHEAFALQEANTLLNEGYTMLFRERVLDAEGESLILYFYKAPEAGVSPQEKAIKKAFRLYRKPPKEGRDGGHPDTRRLNDVIKALIESGVIPDEEEPPTDETEVDVTPRKLEEVGW